MPLYIKQVMNNYNYPYNSLIAEVEWSLDAQKIYRKQKESTQVSLRGLRRLTWFDTFCRWTKSYFHGDWFLCVETERVYNYFFESKVFTT